MAARKEQALVRMAAHSFPGRGHEREGVACQDYARASRGRKVQAIALADGAGSAKLSQVGAELAVHSTLSILRRHFDRLQQEADEACADWLHARLLSALQAAAARNGCELGDLASTLLFVATDGRRYLCGQIGDGQLASYAADQQSLATVFEPSRGEHFNETVFVTSPRARQALRLARGDLAGIGGFALMSDGAAESLYQRRSGEYAPALLRMMDWLTHHTERKVIEALADNLQHALRHQTQDDVSLALLRILHD